MRLIMMLVAVVALMMTMSAPAYAVGGSGGLEHPGVDLGMPDGTQLESAGGYGSSSVEGDPPQGGGNALMVNPETGIETESGGSNTFGGYHCEFLIEWPYTEDCVGTNFNPSP